MVGAGKSAYSCLCTHVPPFDEPLFYSKRSCSGLAACSGNGSHVVAPLGPVVRSSRRSGEMARARPSSSCKATLPSLWIPETTPSRHRPPSRRRNRTRFPAESPSLARAALLSCPSRRRRLKLEPPRPGVRPSARIGALAAPRLSPQQRPAETDPQDRRRGSGDEPLGWLVRRKRAFPRPPDAVQARRRYSDDPARGTGSSRSRPADVPPGLPARHATPRSAVCPCRPRARSAAGADGDAQRVQTVHDRERADATEQADVVAAQADVDVQLSNQCFG